MQYSSGIYDDKEACNYPALNLTHTVLVTGYGREGDKDYWVIKNSWGTGWGEGGYMRILMESSGSGMCAITKSGLY